MGILLQRLWTTGPRVLIVWASLFLAGPFVCELRADGAEESAERLRQAEEALRQERRRSLALNAELVRCQEELAQTRAALAELAVAQQRGQEELARLRLRAANLLVNEADLGEVRLAAALVRERREFLQRQQELASMLAAYERSVEAALTALGVTEDNEVRRLLRARAAALRAQARAAEAVLAPPVAAEPEAAVQQATLLAVAPELGVVALGAGRRQGVRLGSTWQLAGPQGAKVMVKVIELRPALAAAALISGEWNDLVPGAAASLVTEADAAP